MYSSTLFLTSALDGGGWSMPHHGRFTTGNDPVPFVQGAEWTPGPVWKGAENLAPTGMRSPDRLARSESPYRLNCSGPQRKTIQPLNFYFCGLPDDVSIPD